MGGLLLTGAVAMAQPKIQESILSHDGTPKFVKFDYKAAALQLGRADDALSQMLDFTAADELRFDRTTTDELGYTHERRQQYFKGIPVEYGTYTLHALKGTLQSANGEFIRINPAMDITPSINEASALSSAMNRIGAESYMWENGNDTKPAGDLVIVKNYLGDGQPRLAYKFNVYAAQPISRDFVYVDAKTGDILHINPIIKHTGEHAHSAANVAAPAVDLRAERAMMAPLAAGTAATRYSGTQTIDASLSGSSYRLRGTQSGVSINTYDCNTGTNYNSAVDFTDNDNNWTAAEHANAQKDNGALDAHWGAMMTAKYWADVHGRNSWNGSGAAINSYVHYDANYDNAFWNGSVMTYGDGSTFDILTGMDVVAHEIGHAVCETTANLVYSYESGAMNEGFSDIWGACVEATYKNDDNDPWLIGEEIGQSYGPLRSMKDPNAKGDPDTYKGTNWNFTSSDNGGVHTNSGVLNYWFYLLTNGGSGTNDNSDAYSVTGVGMTKAAKIAYRLESVYLSANSQYADARTYGIQAAVDLFGAGSAEEIATTNAWYAVGVGAEYGGGSGGGGGGGTCVPGDVTLSLTTDNYGSETSWTLKNSAGTTLYSGSGYGNNTTITEVFTLADGDYTFTINDSYGDGICCSYGNGSYTLTDGNSGTIKTGGSFASSETTNFCITGTSGGGGGGTTNNCGQATSISATTGNWKYYTWTVDAGTQELVVSISGGTGDADLYVRQGSSNPTTSAYDCRPYKNGNAETCTFTNPTAGTWKIGLRAYSSFSGVTLDICNNGVPALGIDAGEGLVESGFAEGINGFNVYPNPVQDVLNLNLGMELAEGSDVVIYTLSGTEVLRAASSEVRNGINVSGLENGMYLIGVQNDKQNTVMQRFVKQ